MRDAQTIIAAEAAANEKFREKVSETIDLHGLLDHPGWKALQAHFENGKEGFGKELTSRIMRGDEVSQREIDYMRGAREMAEALFKYPTMALASLERTAEQLLRKEFEDEMERDSLASPYIEQED